jgi:imidazolonepropionase-like amidohydrolase
MFEIKILIDLSDQTIKTVKEVINAAETLDMVKTGAFEEYAKAAEKVETKATAEPKIEAPAEVKKEEPQITIEQIRAYCAKAKAAGLNIPSIIHEYGHADLLRNVDPKYYIDIKNAVDAQMKG